MSYRNLFEEHLVAFLRGMHDASIAILDIYVRYGGRAWPAVLHSCFLRQLRTLTLVEREHLALL